jgi:hypothetical protein
MQACDVTFAVFGLPALGAAQWACASEYSKTTAKTTTKTV